MKGRRMVFAGALCADDDAPRMVADMMAAAGCAPACCWQAPDQAGLILAVADSAMMALPRADRPWMVLFSGVLHGADRLFPASGRVSDAERVADAYGRWGGEVFSQIHGDYACVIWDRRTRSLLLARDDYGRVPLFFTGSPGRLYLSNVVRALYAVPGVPRAIDPQGFARHLVLLDGVSDTTLFQSIKRVPPGHVVEHSQRGCKTRSWRRPDEGRLGAKTHDQYAQALCDVMQQVAADHLPADAGVGLSLSSGLDSAAICALTAPLLQRQGREMVAATLVPAGPTSPVAGYGHGDEGPGAARLAAGFANVSHHLVPHELDRTFFDSLDDRLRFDWTTMPLPNVAPSYDKLMGFLARRSCATCLTGTAGNLTVSYSGLGAVHGLLRQGRIWRWGRLLPGLRRAGTGWRTIARLSLGPWAATLPGRGRPRVADTYAIDQAAARSHGAWDHLLAYMTDSHRDATPQALRRLDPGQNLLYVRRAFGIRVADPLADRRLVDFCLGVPEEQFIHGGQPRALIRTAMAGKLPDVLLTSQARGIALADKQVAHAKARERMLDELAAMERLPLVQEFFDLGRVRRILESPPSLDGCDRLEFHARNVYVPRVLAAGYFVRRFQEDRA